MLYDECLKSTFFDLESWIVVLAVLLVALVFRKFGKTVFAITVATAATILGLFWAYAFYEFNCVELYGL